MRSPGYFLWAFRRDWDRGVAASWHDHVVRPRVRRWENPHVARPLESVPVHLVAGDAHADMALWMLAGFFLHTGRNWPVVLHDDGKLSAAQTQIWRSRGLHLQIVPRAEADDVAARVLRAYPLLANYRALHPLGLKLVDVPHQLKGGRGILLDADIAFFSRPEEILAWVDGDDEHTTWFNADIGEASNVSAEIAAARFGVALWERVNSGLCLLGRDVIDLDFCETILREGTIMRGHIWRVEQTLFALNASRANRGGLLSRRYEVSLGKNSAPDCIARHYVGAVRDRFWAEGVRRLSSALKLR